MKMTTVAKHSGLLTAFVALSGALTLAGCSASRAKTLSAAPPPPSVLVVDVKPADIPIEAEFPAQTYARDMVEVRGRVEGYIERWLFKPGSEVRAGQILYVLDLRPYEAALQQAKGNLRQAEADLEFARRQVSMAQAQANLASANATLTKARQDYERLRPLVEADAASKQDLDAASASLKANEAIVNANKANVEQNGLSTRTQIAAMQAKMESLKAAVETAELNLQYGTIRARIDGRIGESLIPVGGLVTPNSPQPLTTIVPLGPIWVRFKVTESEYLGWIQRGHKALAGQLQASLVLADNSEFPQRGRVENTLNQVDSKTGTLELQASFPNPAQKILPGQFGRVRVQVDERKAAIAIPQRAVQQLQNLQTVYTVGPDNKVQSHPVRTGARVGELWVIEQGLQPGDRVIVEGQLRVRPGAIVQAQPYRAAGRTETGAGE